MEMESVPLFRLQPALHFGAFVGTVVVHDEMQGDIARKLGVEPAQEFQKFLMPMSLMTFAYDLTF